MPQPDELVPLGASPANDDDFYNNVFERLVDRNAPDTDQLVGIVAYGLYKLGKREWVLEYIEEHTCRPSAADFRAHAKAQGEMALEGYRSQAMGVVSAYTNSVLETEKPGIVAEARKGTFGQAVWSSYVASVAFALSLIILYFILRFFGVPLPH